jgi:LPS-assembly protein
MAEKLGWIVNPQADNLCGGYYLEPKLDREGQPILPVNESSTNITSAGGGTFMQKGVSNLRGPVVVTQEGRRLEADRATLYRDPKTGKINVVDLYGNVRAYMAGRLVVGNHAHLIFNTKEGYIDSVLYRALLVSDAEVKLHETPYDENTAQLSGNMAWGTATKAIQNKPGSTEYLNASFTTCQPTTNQWRIQAQKLKLDKETGYGSVRNAYFMIGGVPVLYTPYMNFPINKERKTGFLYPTIGGTNNSGFGYGWPFYLNLAPNYDALITPTYYYKRGILWNGMFRYLSPRDSGELDGAIIVNDNNFRGFKQKALANTDFMKQFGYQALLSANNSRSYGHWSDRTQIDQNWSASVNAAGVSDDYFFQDFGQTPSVLTTNQVLRQGNINYNDSNWQFQAMAQGYQTLHPVNRPEVPNIYSRLPDLTLTGYYPAFWDTMDFSFKGLATYYTRSEGPGDTVPPVLGGRLVAQPNFSWPIENLWGYITPTLRVNARTYSLTHQVQDFRPQINSVLPIASIDTGIYFNRDTNFMDHVYTQTIEPRLFYLFVPFQNQRMIPIFDSAYIPFTYDQLFRYNRFSGNDRIGDANQLSAAVTSRIIDQTSGLEKFRISIGQIYYFRHRTVGLCDLTPNCTQELTTIGGTSRTEPTSPVAGVASYHFNQAWSLNSDLAWDFHENKAITGDAFFQYMPMKNHIINFGYTFLRNGDRYPLPNGKPIPTDKINNDLSQIGTAIAWPLTDKWSTLGMVTYNLSHNHPQTLLGGLQYDTCCWALRFVGGQLFKEMDMNGQDVHYTNAFYIQLQLKGLGNVGNNNLSDLLTTQIFGYQDTFK